MKKSEIFKLLEDLGVEDVIDYEANVQIPCLLSEWRDGHSSDSSHSGSMGIRVSDNGESLVNCFSCHWKGTLTHLIQKYRMSSRRKDLAEIVSRVEELEAGDPVQLALSIGKYDENTVVKAKKDSIFCEHLLGMCFSSVHLGYLESRGIKATTLDKWRCLFDYQMQRIVFPIRSRARSDSVCNSSDNLVGAIGRTVVNNPVKYYNYFKFQKARYFFGEHMARPQSIAIVVEGILDAVATWQALDEKGMLEKYCVLGLMGSVASKTQVRRLYEEFSSVIAFFDNDPAGWTGQRSLIKDIQDKTLLRGITYPREPGIIGGDPADIVSKGWDIEQLVESARLIAF